MSVIEQYRKEHGYSYVDRTDATIEGFLKRFFCWRPMDTAPLDKIILVKLQDERVTTARWVPEERHYREDGRRKMWVITGKYWALIAPGDSDDHPVYVDIEPVVWMPLPDL